jgi:hypothetical protein
MNEELERLLFMMSASKAPSPDGCIVDFYQTIGRYSAQVSPIRLSIF